MSDVHAAASESWNIVLGQWPIDPQTEVRARIQELQARIAEFPDIIKELEELYRALPSSGHNTEA